MIYVERTITIFNNEATIESPVVLYKGDKNVQILFLIQNNPFKYKNALEPTFGQLIIKREKAEPIFSEVAKLSSNRVQFIVTEEMIDELRELGSYTFQIRLLNDEHTSRGTLPPIEKGIEIREPILEENVPNIVGTATVNEVKVVEEGGELEVFDEEGNYNVTNWQTGDIISDVKLNKIEQAIYEINEKEVDLSNLATKEELEGYATKEHTHEQYLTEHQNIDHKVDKEEGKSLILDTEIERLANVNNYNDTEVRELIEGKANEIHEHEEYAKTTDVPSIEGLATEEYVNTYVENAINLDLNGYATTKDPSFTGSMSLNPKTNTKLGDYAVNLGYLGEATGYYAVNLGMSSIAEGSSSIAGGLLAKALGKYSSAFGLNIIANGEAQNVIGRFNIKDEVGDYVHIVGNGDDVDARSNAYTLDWNGNGVYSGKVTVGAEPTENMDLTTKKYVDNAISNIDIPQVDLTNYATKEELEGYAEKEHKHEEYLTEHQSLEGYATETYVTNAIANAQLGGDSGEVDLSKYAKLTDLENYAPKEHTHEQYLTEHQDISHLATKEELFSKDYNDLTNKPNIPSIEGLATEDYVNGAIGDITIPTKVSDLTNDSGYITSIPSEYITETELSGMGYLTSSDISNFATKDELFSKDYNDLINKPTIPSIEGLASETYVNEKVKDKIVTTTNGSSSINLTTDKYQYANINNMPMPTFNLPTTTEFAEIHIFFDLPNIFSKLDLISVGTTVKYQGGFEEFNAFFDEFTTYEIIATYIPNITTWLIGVVKYN